MKMNMNIQDKTTSYWMFITISHSEKKLITLLSSVILHRCIDTIEKERAEMKMLTAALAVTRMILCRQGHIFCLTSESTTIIKSSFGCNCSNKHFMSPLIQHPIQHLRSSSSLYILMTSEMSLASDLWRILHAYKYWLNFTVKQQH